MDFNELFNNYWPKVFRLCKGYLGDEALAKDVAQETFITVWQQLHRLRHPKAVSTWLYRITVNNCLKYLKLQQKSRDYQEPIPANYVDEEAHDEEPWRLLQQGLTQLPEWDRMVLGLYLEEVPQKEIAEITGLSPGNIRVRLHRIKKKLSQKIKENGTE